MRLWSKRFCALAAAAIILLSLAGGALGQTAESSRGGFQRLPYNNPGLLVDLGVGLWAWPMPMDWDSDGDLDLVVSCPDVPYNGTYFFENPGGSDKMPVFKPGLRVGPAIRNVRVSYVDGKPRVLEPGREWLDFLGGRFAAKRKIDPGKVHTAEGRVRANQWQYVDYDADGALDLYVGIGDWSDYGWDDAFNASGQWTRGPLHGFVYVLRNKGTDANPEYGPPEKVLADGTPVDVYGMPSPNFEDFDGDGDLDLLCGEFRDGFTYFQNVGTRTQPRYATGRRLKHNGQPLVMDLCMITPTAIDWDGDADIDLVVGDEDGRVALVENTGKVSDGVPVFLPPNYFQQQANDVKFGALVTPVSYDWDADGDEDIIAGNTAGYVAFIENLGLAAGHDTPRWAAPVRLQAAGRTLRIQAGENGSIQGPCEAKWGYTTLSVADWNHDQRPDLVVNSIWGKVVWYRNIGTSSQPKLAAAAPIEVTWSGTPPQPAWNWWSPVGKQLATQWRTTPVVIDWDRDGLNDLVMLDHEGYLSLFRRQRIDQRLDLRPGERIFQEARTTQDGQRETTEDLALRLNAGTAGKSGRRKLCFVDWDGDGRRDLLVNSQNVDVLLNQGSQDGLTFFANQGKVADRKLAGHTTSPTTVDWDGDGVRDLLVGAEDGFLYLWRRGDAE